MGPPTRKVIVRDTTGLPRTWVALQEDSQSKRWVELEPAYEFQKIESRTITYVTYQDKHDLEGPSCAAGDLLFAAPNLSPSTQELSHEEIPGFDICLTCEEVDIRSLLGRRSGMKYLLGPAESIISCESCALCRIITASLEIDTGKSEQELLNLASDCCVVLTSVPSAFPLQARKERHHHIVAHLLHATSAVTVGETSLRISASDSSKIGKTTLFGGLVVDPSNPDFKLASAWLADCDEHHDCLQSADQRSTIERFLVIDVENACLVELPPVSKYLALSYVWPRFDVPKLMKNNIEDFRRPGHFLEMHHQLPRVVRDAIEVVRELGEAYLWIDALCIVQDDRDKKDQLIKKMDRVYGDSYLTIVVASSTSPEEDYAIPGLGSPRRNRQETQQWDGVKLMTAFPDYNSAIERSRWATRGWTFQEGVLSKRCLVFADDQMYFRCARDSRCEDVVTETGTDHYEVHPAKPKFRESKIDYLINPEFLKSMSGEDTFSEYARLVRDYTKRSLTFEFDVLPAFTGIMNMLLPHFQEQAFVVGLPCFSFDRALLWYHTSPARRRQIFACDHGTHDHHCYPSWSWAGWVGSVDYEIDMLNAGDIKSQYPAVSWLFLQDDELVPVRGSLFMANSDFALGLMWSRIDLLRKDPARLISWVTTLKRRLRLPEVYVKDWVTDFDQTLPCFTILDAEGDACGFIPSADRAWAREYKERNGGECELVILSHAQQSLGDELPSRARFFHEKYHVAGNQFMCFFNIMLVVLDAEGVAYRKGVGRIHKDAVHAEDVANLENKAIVLG